LLHPDPERAKVALRTFLEAADSALVEFDDVSSDGEFMHLLTEVLFETGLSWLVTHSVTRPLLRPRGNPEAHPAAALRGDARRKLRSKEKGLSAMGPLRITTVASEADLEEWMERFVRLEAGGWKGKLGTALSELPVSHRYFSTCLREAFRR